MYAAFRASYVAQYPGDAEDMLAALAARDTARVRRVAHNLKGSLRTLGEVAVAEQALWLETAAAQGAESEVLLRFWTPLQAALDRLQ